MPDYLFDPDQSLCENFDALPPFARQALLLELLRTAVEHAETLGRLLVTRFPAGAPVTVLANLRRDKVLMKESAPELADDYTAAAVFTEAAAATLTRGAGPAASPAA